VPRRISGPKTDEVTGGWIRVHNEEIYALYTSPIICAIKLRRMRWAGHVACMRGEKRSTQGFGGKPVERRPLERPRHRWEDNIKRDLRKEGCGGMN
jgi:hypothetical protein